MRAYLAIAARRGAALPPAVLTSSRLIGREILPVLVKDLRADEWISPDGQTALLAWSNEKPHELVPELLTRGSDRVLGYTGYLAGPSTPEALLRADDLGALADGQSGCFGMFRADARGFVGVTSITRVDPVYHAETPHLYIAGSRALLVHLIARAAESGLDRPTIDFDVPALQGMVRQGFFTTDETPFRHVSALPAASTLTVHDGALKVERRPLPDAGSLPSRLSARAKRGLVEHLAEALVASVQPLKRHAEPVLLSLSGGRDSRLIAAVLHAAGVPYRARTHGFGDHPDVVLARRIAQILGIELQVDLPQRSDDEQSVVVEHPLARACHVIRMAEGMQSAYESMNRPGSFGVAPRMSGSGGETLRGGYLYDQADTSLKGVLARIKTIFLAGERFMTKQANAVATAACAEWTAEARKDRFRVLDRLYLEYRTGRWLVGSRTAVLVNSSYYHPFLDNRVVREVLSLSPEWRASEEVVFRLIERLAPALRDVPPEGRRWRFEGKRPSRWFERRAWRARAALPSPGATASFNWRKQLDPDFVRIMSEQILDADGPAQEIFQVADRAAVERLLAKAPMSHPNQGWNLYTLSVLLSERWRTREPMKLPEVRIPIPS